MSAIAQELSRFIKGQSEGVLGFRPWWDVIEDNVLYTFIILGLVILPISFFTGSPVECSYHPRDWYTQKAPVFRMMKDFDYPAQYCTEMLIEPFLRYLPYTLLMIPLILVGIERTFVILYKVDVKMTKFYLLLVKDSLQREDVAKLTEDNLKNCHEIEQVFKNSDSCRKSYLYRTILEIIGALLLASTFGGYEGIIGLGHPIFECDFHGYAFECIVSNTKFYFVVYHMCYVLIAAYILCSSYNLLWLLFTRWNSLARFLNGCQRKRESNTISTPKKAKGPGIYLRLYFLKKYRDFKLLVDLLAVAKGLPESLRILAVFEREFAQLWQPHTIKLKQTRRPKSTLVDGSGATDEAGQSTSAKQGEEDESKKTLMVSWEDCEIADYSASKCHGVFEYSVEVSYEKYRKIKSLEYHKGRSNPTETTELKESGESSSANEDEGKYNLYFEDLEPGKEISVIFSTEIDGRTIVQTIKTFVVHEEGDEK